MGTLESDWLFVGFVETDTTSRIHLTIGIIVVIDITHGAERVKMLIFALTSPTFYYADHSLGFIVYMRRYQIYFRNTHTFFSTTTLAATIQCYLAFTTNLTIHRMPHLGNTFALHVENDKHNKE